MAVWAIANKGVMTVGLSHTGANIRLMTFNPVNVAETPQDVVVECLFGSAILQGYNLWLLLRWDSD